jgi:hypothetical protein
MQRFRDPQFVLILIFLWIIGSVPLLQTGIEARRGEWPQALEVFQQPPTARNLRRFEQNLGEASWLADRLRPWAQYVRFAWLRDGGEKTLVGRDGWLFYKPGVQAMQKNAGTDAVAAIVDFRNQLRARGIALLVVPAPNKESVYPEKLTRRTVQLPNAELRAVLQQLSAADVAVVDLFALFAAAKTNTAAPLYLAQDTHWSPAGVELAAQAVAQRIVERGWVRTGTVDYTRHPAPVERTGDVVRLLQLPRPVAPETVPCQQVVRSTTGEPYRDDPGAEILVLGDSFLRIYETDEPGAAGFIAHLAGELKQPITSLINDGGGATLVRQELHRRPALLTNKKLVIWEFVERDLRLATEGWQRITLPTKREDQPD